MGLSRSRADNNFAGSELGALATEARRKFTDVREAAERAQALIKNPDDALRDLKRGEPPRSPSQLRAEYALTVDGPSSIILSPILLGCQSKNAKLIASAVACLQRLVGVKGAVTQVSPGH